MSDERLLLAPFRGLRYATRDAHPFIDSPALNLALALAPPYDVIDAGTVTHLVHDEPHNAVRLTVPPAAREAGGSAFTELTGPDRYRRAAATLRRWIDEGVLVRDAASAFYAYEQVLPDGRRQRGLIGALRLPTPDSSVVRPHEDTAEEYVTDRARLMAATHANLEPILLFYRGGPAEGRGAAGRVLDTVTDTRPDDGSHPPLIDTVTGDGTTHRLWAVTDPATQADIAADIATRSALIADGHHRYAAYQRLRATHPHASSPWNYGLALLVDSDASPPSLGAIHRVLPGLSPAEAAKRADAVATVERVTEPPAPESAETTAVLRRLRALSERGPAVLLAGSGTWHLVHGVPAGRLAAAMPERSPQWRALPTAALQHLLLPLWGMSDSDAHLVHESVATAVNAARSEEGTAVIVPPMRIEDVYAIAARGEITPRKSTSFGPKPRTGLVMRLVD